MKNPIHNIEIPLGLNMALAQNLDALNLFASMTYAQQQMIIDKTHSISSKQEMQAFVKSFPDFM
ncbi:MAG: hypothetical protein GX802_05925 [Clostridiales bacterium]|nr:hypothetical protein [Clostridiales bacterium]